jgi:hypothetical protein
VRMAVEWGWGAAVSLTAASSGMSWSGHPVLVVRQVSAEKVSSTTPIGSDVARPQPRRARLVTCCVPAPASSLVGALDVFLIRGVDANDVTTLDKHRNLDHQASL